MQQMQSMQGNMMAQQQAMQVKQNYEIWAIICVLVAIFMILASKL